MISDNKVKNTGKYPTDIEGLKSLITSYVSEYNSKKHPFLLFDLAHVNENDHTRVLLAILRYNNYQFLPSFLKMIGAPAYENICQQPTEQKKAIGNKGTGYMDLYFEYKSKSGNTEKVIIENKIFGAADTQKQLERYIATAAGIDEQTFEEKETSWFDCCNKNIIVMYLTSDSDKDPTDDSLPKDLKEKIQYCSINYYDDIIPWLEEEVLPNMPYADGGLAIAGVLQYIAYLKSMFSNEQISEAVKKFVGDKPDEETYHKVVDTIFTLKSLMSKKGCGKYKKDIATIKQKLKVEGLDINNLNLQLLIRDVRAALIKHFSCDIKDGWKSYLTPSFVLLFKDTWWSDSDRKKGYHFPSIHINCSPTNYIFEGNSKISYKIKADHLPTDTEFRTLKDNWKFEVNRSRTISKDLHLENINPQDDYKEFLRVVVKSLEENETIKEIEGIIDKAKTGNKSYQEAVLKRLTNSTEQNTKNI